MRVRCARSRPARVVGLRKSVPLRSPDFRNPTTIAQGIIRRPVSDQVAALVTGRLGHTRDGRGKASLLSAFPLPSRVRPSPLLSSSACPTTAPVWAPAPVSPPLVRPAPSIVGAGERCPLKAGLFVSRPTALSNPSPVMAAVRNAI